MIWDKIDKIWNKIRKSSEIVKPIIKSYELFIK